MTQPTPKSRSQRTIPFTRSSTRKLDFRIVINVINIIIFALLGASAGLELDSLGEDAYTWPLVGITAPAISVLWTTTAIILIFTLRRPSSTSQTPNAYHPAIDLSFDLLSWLVFWILGAFLIAEVAVSEGLIQCAPSPFYTGISNESWCGDNGSRKWSLDTAAGAFFLVNGLIHLVFFSVACQETKVYRRMDWGRKRESFELDRN